MSTQLMAGRWLERGGGVARVAQRSMPKSTYPWYGIDSLDWPSVWTDSGSWMCGRQHEHDLIEYLGPLEEGAKK